MVPNAVGIRTRFMPRATAATWLTRISATPSPRPAVSFTSPAFAGERSIEAPATPPAINAAIPMPLSAFVVFTCITGLLFRLGSSVASGFSEDTSRSVQELGVKDKTHSVCA